MTDVTARASTEIQAPPSAVWNALTDPDLIRQYFLGATVTSDWKVGSPITFAGEWDGQKYEDKGEILALEPERRLSYSHWSPMTGQPDLPENYHVVDITLDAKGDITTVTLEQSNLTGGVTDADRAAREDYEKNWATMLQGLKTTVEG